MEELRAKKVLNKSFGLFKMSKYKDRSSTEAKRRILFTSSFIILEFSTK